MKKHLIMIAAFVFFCGCSSIKNQQSNAQKEGGSNTKLINPVLNQDFPDPTVIYAEGKFYAYGTQSAVNGKEVHIQVASSIDLQNWQHEGDALPVKPEWASHNFWAPDVIYDKAIKKYVLFYSGESGKPGKCLGVAFADHPAGPFVDKGTPLICGETFVNIDPMAFIDPKTGKKLLYWGSGFQPISVREMTDDWKDFKSGSIAQPLVWPGKDQNYSRLIEGAWIDYDNGKYYLYYSGDNCCGIGANYAVMVARSDIATGPFERYSESNGTGSSTILVKDSLWLAPGHNSVFEDGRGHKWIAYHAISRKEDTKNFTKRVLCISPLHYKNGWPEQINME
ncbi:MAG: glycoside hydrolase family 43 protein [Sphingobacteriaceae bacterium]